MENGTALLHGTNPRNCDNWGSPLESAGHGFRPKKLIGAHMFCLPQPYTLHQDMRRCVSHSTDSPKGAHQCPHRVAYSAGTRVQGFSDKLQTFRRRSLTLFSHYKSSFAEASLAITHCPPQPAPTLTRDQDIIQVHPPPHPMSGQHAANNSLHQPLTDSWTITPPERQSRISELSPRSPLHHKDPPPGSREVDAPVGILEVKLGKEHATPLHTPFRMAHPVPVCTSRAQENCTGLGMAVLKYHQGRNTGGCMDGCAADHSAGCGTPL